MSSSPENCVVIAGYTIPISPAGRRMWPREVRASIATESLEPTANSGQVIKKYKITANMLSCWRRSLKSGKYDDLRDGPPSQSTIGKEDILFVPAIVSDSEVKKKRRILNDCSPIEIVSRGSVIRLSGDVSVERIAKIVQALESA